MGLLLALALMACGRTSNNTNGPSVGSVYAGRVVQADLGPVVPDATAWWQGPPTFGVRPLNSATRLDQDKFDVTVRFAHAGTREEMRLEYQVWISTAIATAVMDSTKTALGNSLSGAKAGDQVLYYNRNLAGGPAPYANEALVRVGQTVVTIVWTHIDGFASTGSVGKIAVKAAGRLKDSLAGKVQASPAPSPDAMLLAPPGPDLTLLGTARLPVEVVPQILVFSAPADMTKFFHQVGVSDVVYGDYAVNVDTRMEVLTSGFTFASPTGSKEWIDTFYGGSTGLTQGVYLNFESDTGQYVAAFGLGNKGVLMVCKSSASGEEAGRSCESAMVRVIPGWRLALGGA